MRIDANTRMAAVIANPIRHSLSPFIHNLAFELTEENAVYLAWEVEEKDFSQVIGNIGLLDMYGVNLSMPYKSLVIELADELSKSAQIIGAANTIVNQNGRLIAHNTDGLGFFKSLEKHDFCPEDKTITILGSGAAARAIISEAVFRNANKISVFARKSSSFHSLESWIKSMDCQIQLCDLDRHDLLQEAVDSSDLFVNATSLGMDGVSMPISEKLKGHSSLLVADVIYKQLTTPFLQWAERQNLKTTNGLGMLICQAAESFRLWTGKEMPVEKIEKGLTKKLYDRSLIRK